MTARLLSALLGEAALVALDDVSKSTTTDVERSVRELIDWLRSSAFD